MLSQAVRLLRQARLGVMAERLEQWVADPVSVTASQTECVMALVEALLAERTTQRQRSFARRSALPANVSLAAVRTHPAGKHALTARVLSNLATCDWVRAGRSIVVTGPTQAGKSFLAMALAQEATLAKLSTRYLRTSHWVAKCEQAASSQAVLDDIRALTKVKLLVLDDFATQVADARHSHWLREVLDARECAGVSTLIVATPPMEEWDERFEDKLAADAIVGRALQAHYRLQLP
ncbi:ATP-binding protein [Luteibacter sp.]|jgi:DNA replication protein DnaC|uniref:ATP-binding protein n=1 Tax=Luteibacter sp. TaxID=1886636 RepID=UPI002F3EA001